MTGPDDVGHLGRPVEQVMGMPISLALRGRGADDAAAEVAWQRVIAYLRDVDRTFSTYRNDSVVSRFARGEIELGDCPPDFHEVDAIAERARVESGGAFDVRRPRPDGSVEYDPSGVVKGWAVARAALLLEEELVDTDFCLSGGGDMVCRTRSADSPPWRIGIENPGAPDQIVAVVEVANGGVATSGLAHRGAHIVDPRTGTVPGALASVTVIAPDLTWADIDATAAFVMGEDARAWLEARGRTGLIVLASGATVIVGEPGARGNTTTAEVSGPQRSLHHRV